MSRCTKCGSHAINEHLHGRIKGKNSDLCDVCYWRRKHELLAIENQELRKDGMTIYAMMEDGRAKAAATRCAEIAGQTSKVAEHRIKIEFDLLPESNTPIKFKGNL